MLHPAIKLILDIFFIGRIFFCFEVAWRLPALPPHAEPRDLEPGIGIGYYAAFIYIAPVPGAEVRRKLP